jgi:hypothetical protein
VEFVVMTALPPRSIAALHSKFMTPGATKSLTRSVRCSRPASPSACCAPSIT